MKNGRRWEEKRGEGYSEEKHGEDVDTVGWSEALPPNGR